MSSPVATFFALPSLIVEQRKALGQTQAQAAAELGVSERTLQGWEAGTATPQPRYRHALAAWLTKEAA